MVRRIAKQTAADPTAENEKTILARILVDACGELSADLAQCIVDSSSDDGDPPAPLFAEMAQQLLDASFSDRAKARMHDLAVRNQDDALSDPEKEELARLARAGTLLSILKSKARRALGISLETQATS